jgi:hypothetical protein
MTSAMTHPCQFSPEVLDVLGPLIQPGEHIHDPFAGTGLRLAALCDEIGAEYSGADIEQWPGADRRVWIGDATKKDSYPYWSTFRVVTSPVYLNKRLADYANGPLPTTKIKGRRDYGISLGRALHPGNLARHTGKPARAAAYWHTHSEAVKHWGDRALVNVDSPIAAGWRSILEAQGFTVTDEIPVYTQRYGGLDNAEKRAEFEVVMICERTSEDPLFGGA